MTRQDEERHQLELALVKMEKHLLAALEQTFKEKKRAANAAQTERANNLLQRFFNRPK
jgi:hypothetical protein